jgi:hypothetical protein
LVLETAKLRGVAQSYQAVTHAFCSAVLLLLHSCNAFCYHAACHDMLCGAAAAAGEQDL